MHNSKYQCHMAAHTTDQLTSPRCEAGAIEKRLSLNEKYWKETSWTLRRIKYKPGQLVGRAPDS